MGNAPTPDQVASAKKHASPEQIAQYLQSFDNDVEAAIAALRSHAQVSFDALPKRAQSARLPHAGTAVSVRNVFKTYAVSKQAVGALQDVSLDIDKGEFVVITGPSGSGKSTLLQLIGGLDRPSRGDILVDGALLGAMNDRHLSHFRGQTIGFVFQFFYLQPFLRLRRNLEVPGMFARTKRAERQQRVQELAEAVGLADRLDHLPRELSGGQIQRAAIARALFNRPKILLADEPTGNLDSKNGGAIIDLFEQIRNDFGTTVVVVTHDLTIARRADRVIVLKDGAIV